MDRDALRSDLNCLRGGIARSQCNFHGVCGVVIGDVGGSPLFFTQSKGVFCRTIFKLIRRNLKAGLTVCAGGRLGDDVPGFIYQLKGVSIQAGGGRHFNSRCPIDLFQLLDHIHLGICHHIVIILLGTEIQRAVSRHAAAVVGGGVAADVHNIAADAVQLLNVRLCGVRGQNQVVVGVADRAQADGDFISAVHASPAVAAAAWHPVAHHAFALF